MNVSILPESFSLNHDGIFFFLVLCLPSQVRTSNGAIHHDVQLSPSTCGSIGSIPRILCYLS